MKTLFEIYRSNNFETDKNTCHSYIDHVYSELFFEIQESSKNILEIGIDKGGSILLWKEYFLNATITGIDIKDKTKIFKNKERLKILQASAYDKTFINSIKENYFDLIIDDGPHSLKSMILFLNGYQSKLNKNGILVIEDVRNISWIETLKKHVHKDLIKNIYIYDLTKIKNRFDDILFVIDKRKINH